MARSISDWILVRTDLPRDPKVTRMTDLLRKTLGAYILRQSPDDLLSGVTPRVTCHVTDLVTSHALRDIVTAALERVWSATNAFIKGDTIPGVGVEWVDEVSQITGFGRAMQKVGWLDITENGLQFPNFGEYNRPKTNALRSDAATRKERERLRKWLATNDTSHADYHAKKSRLVTIESRVTLRDMSRDCRVTVTPYRTEQDSIKQQLQPPPPAPPASQPRTENSEPRTANRDRGIDLETARTWADTFNRSNAEGIHIPMPVVTAWHDDRTATGWNTVRDGTEFPIRDWQADLRRYARKWQQNERSPKPTNGHRTTPSTPPLTTPKKNGW